jgi:hypothetical protein
MVLVMLALFTGCAIVVVLGDALLDRAMFKEANDAR